MPPGAPKSERVRDPASQGDDGDDTITVSGDHNDYIDASIPASEASKERLPFPLAERGPMPPGDSEERARPRPRVVGRRR